ncbi:MAG TPA: elongation factor 1-alpha [Candidatus Bathyarchaeota archaeon]|nr:elongation factor 1-alpha [Candidatus Bathyarchaeota archaeon]HEW89829.1 elongation factor 1-alpha [Candidatus Bathyarchaeota archaeon]
MINLIFLGDAGHGKSTLIGRLLYEVGKVGEGTVARLRRLASEVKDERYYLAYIVDRQLEERRRGHTIDVSSCEPVRIGENVVRMINAPGVRDWMGNAIAGITQADAAVLVVDAHDAEARGLRGLVGLREHLILASAFGVEQVVVAINKMDLVGYEERAYERVRSGLVELMGSLGYKGVEEVPFIPVSALRGDNVIERGKNMPWYSGPTFYEALGSLREPERPVEKPLRLPIHRYFERGSIAAGVVEAGVVSVGDTVMVVPAGAVGEVLSMEMWGRRVEEAYPGDDVGIRIKGVARYHLKRGFVISHPEVAPEVARSFIGRVKVLSPRGLWAGFCPTLYCHQARAPCRVRAILRKVDPSSGSTLEERPGSLAEGEVGDVLLEPLVPKQRGLVIERHGDFPPLARFVLRASVGKELGPITVATGVCLDVEPYGD